MTDPLFHFASFFVALLIALGAIPFGREVIRKVSLPDTDENQTVRSAVGGFALLMSIGLSTFYISTTIPNIASGLGYGAVVALVLAVFDKFARQKFELTYMTRAIINLFAMVFVTVVLLKPTYLVSNASPLPSWLLLAVCSLLPLAFARTGELTDKFAPCRTSYLFCVMIAGVVLVGLHADFATVDGTSAVVPVLAVFLTVFSALLGCLFYMADFPWRRGSITMGLLGHLVLGLSLAWAALLMASTSVRPAVTVVSLTLIVAAPMYSSLCYWLIRRFGSFNFVDPRSELPYGYKLRAALVDYSMTVALVMAGLFVTWSGMHWALALAVLPVSFIACLFLIVFHSTMSNPLSRRPAPAISSSSRRLDFE
jgi:hypothetical protein